MVKDNNEHSTKNGVVQIYVRSDDGRVDSFVDCNLENLFGDSFSDYHLSPI